MRTVTPETPPPTDPEHIRTPAGSTEHEPPGGRSTARRAREALLARPRVLHVVLLGICFMLGTALVTQVRAQQTDPLETLSQQDLVLLLDELTSREGSVREEKTDLEGQLAQLRDAASEQEAAAAAAQKALDQARINAGTVAVHGPGLVMTVQDPARALDSLQFVMALGELRNAGAEAIELNGVRVTPRSWFTSDEGGPVVLDGTALSPPYRWVVIGDAATIEPALEIQAGSAQQMRALGADVSITPVDDVQVEAVVTPTVPRWASVE